MKIDEIINVVKDTTNEVIIITNQETIDSFLDDIKSKTSESSVGYYKEKTENDNGVNSVYRNGVNLYFINKNNIDSENFLKPNKNGNN